MSRNPYAITGFLESIPKSVDSHYRGWMELCASRIEDCGGPRPDVLLGPDAHERWKDYSGLIFHHGLYYYGEDYSLNVFGGATPEWQQKVRAKVEALLDHFGRNGGAIGVCSLEHPWPKTLFQAIRGRLGDEPNVLRDLTFQLEQMVVVRSGDHVYDPWKWTPHTEGVILGDSHSGASWEPGYTIRRGDRETLFGSIRRGFAETIKERFKVEPSRFKRAKFHYGNIDIRHHLCRQPDPLGAARGLARSYVTEIEKTGIREVTLVAPYPIENESRKIAKSVWYKGTPFFGSWTGRDAVRQAFTGELILAAAPRGWKVHCWPSSLCNQAGELRFDCMEKPQSIHLSPRHYVTPVMDRYRQAVSAPTLEGFFE